MISVQKIAAVLLFAVGFSLADDFMGLPIEDGASKDERPLPTWIFGGEARLPITSSHSTVR